jgi:hypothetical protein
MACYKNEEFPMEFRAHCAGLAIKYEKPALQAVDQTVRILATTSSECRHQ